MQIWYKGAMVINPIFEKNERGQKHPLEVLESETVSCSTVFQEWQLIAHDRSLSAVAQC